MKKIIAWLVVFLSALFNNVEYTPSEVNVPFNEEAMYIQGATGNVNEPRNSAGRVTDATLKNCLTNTYSGNAIFVNYENVEHGTDMCWFEAVNQSDVQEIKISDIQNKENPYTCTGSVDIIAPCTCRILSSPKSNDCTYIELLTTEAGIPTYKITIMKMKGWYCDQARDITYPSHHTYAATTTVFKRGDVIGKAVSGETTITVRKIEGSTVSDKEITLSEFYTEKAY